MERDTLIPYATCPSARLPDSSRDRPTARRPAFPTGPTAGSPSQLTARTGSTAEAPELIGNYHVETDNYDGRYLGPVIEARPGDSIAFTLDDELDPAEKTQPTGRLHADGQRPEPSPRPRTMSTKPHEPAHARAAGRAPERGRPPRQSATILSGSCRPRPARLRWPCPACRLAARPPGSSRSTSPLRCPREPTGTTAGAPHPSGLFWYHPHVHGIAQHQVNGGMAGLISVGRPARGHRGSGEPGVRPLYASKVDVRYLAIKDIQLTADRLPELATVHQSPDGDLERRRVRSRLLRRYPRPSDTSKAVVRQGLLSTQRR